MRPWLQPDSGLGYLVRDGSTLSEDDIPQQNHVGAIGRDLSGTCGGPEDGIAPENSGGIVILSQASKGAMSEASAWLEITGSVSPPDRSVHVINIGEVRPPDKKQSLMSRDGRS
eukprot:356657-Chlamydomonas_euryale.AAC.1